MKVIASSINKTKENPKHAPLPFSNLLEPHYEQLKVIAILIQFVSNESLPPEETMNHMANYKIIKLL